MLLVESLTSRIQLRHKGRNFSCWVVFHFISCSAVHQRTLAWDSWMATWNAFQRTIRFILLSVRKQKKVSGRSWRYVEAKWRIKQFSDGEGTVWLMIYALLNKRLLVLKRLTDAQAGGAVFMPNISDNMNLSSLERKFLSAYHNTGVIFWHLGLSVPQEWHYRSLRRTILWQL